MDREDDLATRLSRAIADYRATWNPVDVELYELCRRRPSQSDFPDVYTKVAVIGRVYEAGISRAWRGDGEPESGVAYGLIDVADLIKKGLDSIADRPLDRPTAAEIVELHGHVTRAISCRSGNVWLASFVSKYLHFHCSQVPIYDSNAQAAIGQYVDWHRVTPVRDAMVDLSDWARAYRNFVAAFVVLRERIVSETSIAASVKETDHLLWQSQ